MSTDYNTIAQEYKQAKQQPWRLYIEAFTLDELLGDLTGKAVLDLACGEGFHTRAVKRKGAARVVGVDLSERMIELARQEERQQPLGIEYLVHDARQLRGSGNYDLVMAAYLLNYAQTRQELLEMCQAITSSLKPGGRFVTVNNNPAHRPEHFPATKKYGFTKEVAGELSEGAPVTWRIFQGGGSFDIINYHLSVATHEWALRQAGFREVRWLGPRLSPAGEKAYGQEFWKEFLEHPSITFIECTL